MELMEVVKSHGCVCLKGPGISHIATAALEHLGSHPELQRAFQPHQDLQRQGQNYQEESPYQDGLLKSSTSINDSTLNVKGLESKSFDGGGSSSRLFAAGFRDSTNSSFSIEHAHVTLLTKEEVASCEAPREELLQRFQDQDSTAFFPAGIAAIPAASSDHRKDASEQATAPFVACVSCVWNAANAVRQQLGLPLKDFHISLGPAVSRLQCHSLACLLPSSPFDIQEHQLMQMCKAGHQAGLHEVLRALATQLCQRYPENAQSWCILGAAAGHGLQACAKLALAAYHKGWSLSQDDKVQAHCVKGMQKASASTAWGPICTAEELQGIPEALRDPLLNSSWSGSLQAFAAAGPILHATAMFAPNGMRLPRFLSWILPFRLAASATPKTSTDIAALKAIGIHHIYTLTEEEPLPPSFFGLDAPQHTFSPVPNGKAPTFTQVDLFVDTVAAENACVLVHCGGGKGRAGTFAACCLALWGSSPPPDLATDRPVMSAQEAIRAVRHLRPGSIETQEQEIFVQAWVKHRWRMKAAEALPEPEGFPLELEGKLSLADVRLVMLVGLPGAGKSWFAEALSKRRKVVIISQDESRSRSACESQLGASVKHAPLTILDRCNVSRADRKAWLDIAGCPEETLCVDFCYSQELCLQRGNARLDHPTLRPGRMTNAMDQMVRGLQSPCLQEGFGRLAKIHCQASAFDLALQLGGQLPFYKFPRTSHLVNLGAATDDDLITSSPASQDLMGDIVVEEKVDGACMGMSLAADLSVLVQNRSRYVTSKTHAQFVKLGAWIASREQQVVDLLHRDAQFPERYMLFGEWLAAKHAIHYTAIPDLFLAFDLYDRLEDTFVSRGVLSALLKDTDIQQVPLMSQQTGKVAISELCQMTNGQSALRDGLVEGVYVRLQDNGHTVQRYKIVRADFAPGRSDWSKHTIYNEMRDT